MFKIKKALYQNDVITGIILLTVCAERWDGSKRVMIVCKLKGLVIF